MKKGLVLEGGAMRGVYTAGVLDVLMEKGIEADVRRGGFRLQLYIPSDRADHPL